MRILGYLTHAWPHQRGGSETAAHGALSWLASRGHEVRCLVIRHRGLPIDGVDYAQLSARRQGEWWDWCDVAISQQGSTTGASQFADIFAKPVAHWAHNWHYLDGHLDEMNPNRDLLAFNSRALQNAQGDLWAGRSMVLHPPTFPGRWGGTGDRVTQVNLSNLKGGALFFELARRLPDVDFLGVNGWGEQIRGAAPNVRVLPSTPDMPSVYAQTRILIVPTLKVSDRQTGESWGMAAAEAAACGIPVIASKSPGMLEQLGDAAIWCDPTDPDEWVAAIRRLQGPDAWARQSDLIRTRTADPTCELESFEAHLSEMCGALV